MANLRDIRKRIKSINNTAKVTHAMELVAAAKMRKSQEKTLAARPYTNTLHKMIANLGSHAHHRLHQLLRSSNGGKKLVILITSDRGLVGGLNLNIFREIAKDADYKNFKFVLVGKKGLAFCSRAGLGADASFLSDEQPFLALARTLSRLAIGSFVTGEADSVWVTYPQFESTIKQTPTMIKILPIEAEALEQSGETEPLIPASLLFEPSADEILENILPHHVLVRIYQTLLDAKASEHSARMVAMKNATDAASDLVDDLTLTYNQARQEAVTRELLDIVTAQSAFG